MSITRRPDSIIKEAIKKREPELLHSNEITQCDNETISLLLKSIFLNKPTDAYWIISNLAPDFISRIKFSLEISDVAKTQMHTFDVAENTAMYHCLTQMDISFDEYQIDIMSNVFAKNIIQLEYDEQYLRYNYRVINVKGEKATDYIPRNEVSKDFILENNEQILANKDKILLPILNYLYKKKVIHEYYKKIINEYIQADSPHAVSLALHLALRAKRPISLLEYILPIILEFDSFHCLEQLINHPNFNQEVAAKFTSNENINDYPIEMLKNAILAQAPKSIATILKLKLFKPKSERITDILENLIKESAGDANLISVLALCENDFNKAANYLLKDSLFPDDSLPATTYSPKNLFDSLITMLRFSPIEIVDNVVEAYINGTHPETNKELLQQQYSEAKSIFFKYAPTCSRYTNQVAFQKFKHSYYRPLQTSLKDKAKSDMEYGKERYELVKNLVEEMKLAMEGKSVLPKKPELQILSSSSNKSNIFAALLEKIIDYHAKKSMRSDFRELRGKGWKSPVEDTYVWAKPLVSATFHHSDSKQIRKYTNSENDRIYELTYTNNSSPLTYLDTKTPRDEDTYWFHG